MRKQWVAGLAALLAMPAASMQAQDQMTAYEALKVVGRQYQRAALNRVVSVTGSQGDPQPRTWRVVILDGDAPGGVRELQVSRGRIVKDRAAGDFAGAGEGAVIRTSALNLDSNGAFTVANYTADKSHTGFDSVTYTLRNNDRGTPVWVVTLQDRGRRPVGTIHISANRGNVTRVEGMFAGSNAAPPPPPPQQEDRRVPPGRSTTTHPPRRHRLHATHSRHLRHGHGRPLLG